MTSEVFIRYVTTTGLEKTARFSSDTTCVNLELRDMVSVDLLPLIWCTNLQVLSIRNNSLTEVDLSALERCKNLRVLRLGNNRLQEIDLDPLAACTDLEEVCMENNRLKIVDLSPLFQCSKLLELRIDESVSLTADLLLRSIGSWPEVLIERYNRILWKSSTPR
ncbi:leucine-rich repeat domain-containing protein [Candidatus Thorarchaeota archaeon]|nr:MAG: leucine-rich repeat domain-containing protein [Candidatus Thorarchaeota archaeon]